MGNQIHLLRIRPTLPGPAPAVAELEGDEGLCELPLVSRNQPYFSSSEEEFH